MTITSTEPIQQHWIDARARHATSRTATAADVTRRLAAIDVCDIDDALAPLLAAAAAEVALGTGIPWRYRSDDPPVASLRLIANVAVRNPDAGGPHTARLLDRLP
jgi:hypothetical protein